MTWWFPHEFITVKSKSISPYRIKAYLRILIPVFQGVKLTGGGVRAFVEFKQEDRKIYCLCCTWKYTNIKELHPYCCSHFQIMLGSLKILKIHEVSNIKFTVWKFFPWGHGKPEFTIWVLFFKIFKWQFWPLSSNTLPWKEALLVIWENLGRSRALM